MSNQNVSSSRAVVLAVVICLAIFLCAGRSRAQSTPANYAFLLASGFLCDPADSATCPAEVKSLNGDSYAMSGAGKFDALNKSVKVAGSFTHKSSNGTVLQTGVWIASELISFDPYGIVPGALLQRKRTIGPAPFGPNRLPMSSGPIPTGGLAVFRIRFLPMSGPSRTSVLQVNCALGNLPRERSVEGIRLTFERGDEFSEEVGGRVMFLSMQPEVSLPAKAAQQEGAPGTAEPPRH